MKPSITAGYKEDFESQPAGWSSYGTHDQWEWGIPGSGPGTAFSGDKVYATNLSGPYADSANMNLVMPPIQVPETGRLFLQFKSWHKLEEFLITGMCSFFRKENHIGSRRPFTMVTPQDGTMKRQIYLRIKAKT